MGVRRDGHKHSAAAFKGNASPSACPFGGLENVNAMARYYAPQWRVSVSVSAQPTAFFAKTYDETLGLLVEVRDYVVEGEQRDRAALTPVVGAKLSCEALRVTARLT